MSSVQPVPILMYHSIATHSTPAFSPYVVSPQVFAAQMAYLAENHYTPLTVTQFIGARASQAALPPHPVVLTFDDGFGDFYEQAWPILQRHGFVATLYVTTSFVGQTSAWLGELGEAARRMVTWDQLAELSQAGIECGGHGHAHPQLDLISLAQAKVEIARSKELLETHLRREVLSFAYPHGYNTQALCRFVRSAGYTSACAVRDRMSSVTDDAFRLGRLMISPGMALATFGRLLRQPFVPDSLFRSTLFAWIWRGVRLVKADRYIHIPAKENPGLT